MNLSWFISLEFVKALLMVIGALSVIGGCALALTGWWLNRNADGLNRHSSSH